MEVGDPTQDGGKLIEYELALTSNEEVTPWEEPRQVKVIVPKVLIPP
jgi:hypothetical protein